MFPADSNRGFWTDVREGASMGRRGCTWGCKKVLRGCVFWFTAGAVRMYMGAFWDPHPTKTAQSTAIGRAAGQYALDKTTKERQAPCRKWMKT